MKCLLYSLNKFSIILINFEFEILVKKLEWVKFI